MWCLKSWGRNMGLWGVLNLCPLSWILLYISHTSGFLGSSIMILALPPILARTEVLATQSVYVKILKEADAKKGLDMQESYWRGSVKSRWKEQEWQGMPSSSFGGYERKLWAGGVFRLQHHSNTFSSEFSGRTMGSLWAKVAHLRNSITHRNSHCS